MLLLITARQLNLVASHVAELPSRGCIIKLDDDFLTTTGVGTSGDVEIEDHIDLKDMLQH